LISVAAVVTSFCVISNMYSRTLFYHTTVIPLYLWRICSWDHI